MASYSLDTLPTCIEYHSANLYYTYTMYNPVDIHWDVLNDIMSLYYLQIYRIFGLKGLEHNMIIIDAPGPGGNLSKGKGVHLCFLSILMQ